MNAICQHLWPSRENCTAWLHEVLFAMLMEQLYSALYSCISLLRLTRVSLHLLFCVFQKVSSGFQLNVCSWNFPTTIPLCSVFNTRKKKHQNWFAKIKSVVAKRIPSEEQVTSFTSLLCHWLKSWWVSRMWLNSSLVDHYCSLSPSEQSGWLFNHDKSSVLIGASLSESHTSVSALHMFVHAYCLADHLQLINATLQWVQHSAVTTVT